MAGVYIRRVEILRGYRPLLYLIQCQHRDVAPCITMCPTGASYKDVDGLVMIREELCIGCKYCMVACPYEVRWLDKETDLPEKCMGDECLSRVKAGLDPVCVAVCPADAGAFGDVDDPHSEISGRLAKSRYVRLLENKGTEPRWWGHDGVSRDLGSPPLRAVSVAGGAGGHGRGGVCTA